MLITKLQLKYKARASSLPAKRIAVSNSVNVSSSPLTWKHASKRRVLVPLVASVNLMFTRSTTQRSQLEVLTSILANPSVLTPSVSALPASGTMKSVLENKLNASLVALFLPIHSLSRAVAATTITRPPWLRAPSAPSARSPWTLLKRCYPRLAARLLIPSLRRSAVSSAVLIVLRMSAPHYLPWSNRSSSQLIKSALWSKCAEFNWHVIKDKRNTLKICSIILWAIYLY